MISQEAFHNWKHNDVTEQLIEVLLKIRESVQEQMTNPSVIMELDSRARLHRLAGICEGLDVVLNLEYLTLSEEEHNEDDTNRT